MIYGTQDFEDFKRFLSGVGYSELPLSKSPYEVYRGSRKLPDGTRDVLVLYKKSSGLISFQKKDVDLYEAYKRQKDAIGRGNETALNRPTGQIRNTQSFASEESLWQEAQNIACDLNSCSTREMKMNVLAGVTSVQVLRRVAILLTESF